MKTQVAHIEEYFDEVYTRTIVSYPNTELKGHLASSLLYFLVIYIDICG